ncbi:hypothetical protein C7N77_18945 [Aeromonas rivipollensis]|nr:hypothetical protein C7N77_18945 [Aeromonas rivipollensis]
MAAPGLVSPTPWRAWKRPFSSAAPDKERSLQRRLHQGSSHPSLGAHGEGHSPAQRLTRNARSNAGCTRARLTQALARMEKAILQRSA